MRKTPGGPEPQGAARPVSDEIFRVAITRNFHPGGVVCPNAAEVKLSLTPPTDKGLPAANRAQPCEPPSLGEDCSPKSKRIAKK